MYSQSTTPDSGRGPWALIEAGGRRVGVILAIGAPAAALPALFAGRRLLPAAQLQHE
ncbi:MAG: hypothetical protein ACRDPE_19635 [Solirubrobacterales bacterium]